MNLKEFLKPNKKKVLLTIVLFPIMLGLLTIMLKSQPIFYILSGAYLFEFGVYLFKVKRYCSNYPLDCISTIIFGILPLLLFIFFIYLISCLFLFSLKLHRIKKYSISILCFLVISLLFLIVTQPSVCYFNSDKYKMSICFYDKVTEHAIKNLDENECLKIPKYLCFWLYCTDGTARDKCLQEVFSAKKSLPKDCKDFDWRSKCEYVYYYFLSELSVQQNNVSLCDLV